MLEYVIAIVATAVVVLSAEMYAIILFKDAKDFICDKIVDKKHRRLWKECKGNMREYHKMLGI